MSVRGLNVWDWASLKPVVWCADPSKRRGDIFRLIGEAPFNAERTFDCVNGRIHVAGQFDGTRLARTYDVVRFKGVACPGKRSLFSLNVKDCVLKGDSVLTRAWWRHRKHIDHIVGVIVDVDPHSVLGRSRSVNREPGPHYGLRTSSATPLRPARDDRCCQCRNSRDRQKRDLQRVGPKVVHLKIPPVGMRPQRGQHPSRSQPLAVAE